MMSLRAWFRTGAPWIWLIAGSVSISLFMVLGVLALTAFRGLGYFWPADIAMIKYEDPAGQTQQAQHVQHVEQAPSTLVGEIQDTEYVTRIRLQSAGITLPDDVMGADRYLLKVGNRETFGADFRWIIGSFIREQTYPPDLLVVERREWGNYYGFLRAVKKDGKVVAEGPAAWEVFQSRVDEIHETMDQINVIEKKRMGAINYRLEHLRLDENRLRLKGELDAGTQAGIQAARTADESEFAELEKELSILYAQINDTHYLMEIMDGRQIELPLANVVRALRPNDLNAAEKSLTYLKNLFLFLTESPREANTEGGIFPAIFGTVLMVMLMSLLVTPLGVVAAIYLREYAKQGFLTQLIRIAVNNLAGVPSIVYGLFGLGFFVYMLGGSIDRLFYPEALPAPTFGTGGILWASLTLAILTLPVVIVATEEGLSRIPRAIREGSLALGATKAETLWRTIIPMASPAILTGSILAVARAAGEVAPLMLVGVVKLAPTLPLDGNAPFLHLDRKFMHLGFHIYDVGFQSPNVEAARPLVYATAFLLVIVVIVLNLAAIHFRNRLRETYRDLES